MEVCHGPSVTIIEALLKKLPGLDLTRALEVACGDGRLSKDLLQKWFKKIDLFDQCSNAITEVKKLRS